MLEELEHKFSDQLIGRIRTDPPQRLVFGASQRHAQVRTFPSLCMSRVDRTLKSNRSNGSEWKVRPEKKILENKADWPFSRILWNTGNGIIIPGGTGAPSREDRYSLGCTKWPANDRCEQTFAPFDFALCHSQQPPGSLRNVNETQLRSNLNFESSDPEAN